MASVPETSTWTTGIYQLEVIDPVQGGAAGVDNQQAKGLASRTLWLKDRLAALAVAADLVEVVVTSTDTWTAPVGVTEILILEARAPGGGGAGVWYDGSSIQVPGGGGGEGAVLSGVTLDVVAGTAYTISIGAAGAGGTSFTHASTFDSGVLGGTGGDITFGTLLTIPGGAGGGLSSPNGMSSSIQGMSMGDSGGSVTVSGVSHRGHRGGDATLLGRGGHGGGPGGGTGGWGSSPAPTAGVSGGGGGGSNHRNHSGAAGGDGFIRFCYIANTVTGNT